jgi:hypothetical protein
MISVVAVRPNVILGRHYPFSPQIELSIFIFSQNIIDWSKTHPFSIAFKLCFKDMFAKGKYVEQLLIKRAAHWRGAPIGGG